MGNKPTFSEAVLWLNTITTVITNRIYAGSIPTKEYGPDLIEDQVENCIKRAGFSQSDANTLRTTGWHLSNLVRLAWEHGADICL